MRRSLVLAAVLAAALPAAGQDAFTLQFFPVVARGPGLSGTQWVTDLTIHNPIDDEITIGRQFFPANQANALDMAFPDRFDLAARQTRLFEDVLAEIFGYDTDVKGVLLVTVDSSIISGNSEEANIAGITRTYNISDPDGTYGQSVPGLEVFSPTSAPVVATGARHDDSYRSNVGVVSLAMFQPITVHYRVLGADGTVQATGTRNVPQLSLRQWSFDQLGVDPSDGPMTVELWLDEDDVAADPCDFGSPTILGYVSKVDNGTDDAEFIYAFLTGPDPCE